MTGIPGDHDSVHGVPPDDYGLGDGLARTLQVDDEMRQELDRVYGREEPQRHRSMDKRHMPKRRDPEPLPADVVVLPNHYSRFKIEPVHFIGENRLEFELGNGIKYIMRAPFKHPGPDGFREDISKGIRCIIMWAKKHLGDPAWAGPYRTDIAALLAKELAPCS